jgi:hypothetical protein
LTFVNDYVGRPRRVHVDDHDHVNVNVYVDVVVNVHVRASVHVRVTSFTQGRGPLCLVGAPPS